jgi:putative MFS transporter
VTVAGFAGRLLFSFLPNRIGRRVCGMLMGAGAALFYVLTALLHDAFLGAVSLFWLGMLVADVFSDGGFANLAPFTPEAFPARLRGHARALPRS